MSAMGAWCTSGGKALTGCRDRTHSESTVWIDLSDQKKGGQIMGTITVAEVIARYRDSGIKVFTSPEPHYLAARNVFVSFEQAYGALAATDLTSQHLADFIAAHPSWKSPGIRKSRAGLIRKCFFWAAKKRLI